MVGLDMLWLPILLSAVFVFILSSIIHTVLPWHKGDYKRLPNEEGVMDALRPFAVPPGDYFFPRPIDMKDMCKPEHVEKQKKGPVWIVTVMPNGPGKMTKSLVLWFLYSLVISIFAAYITGRAPASGKSYLEVFRFAGCSAFMGYAISIWQMSIWYHRSWETTIKTTIDGLLYALVTAGTFGWLWPR